eukprot:3337927-Pyramimonas_sp.AAC.1
MRRALRSDNKEWLPAATYRRLGKDLREGRAQGFAKNSEDAIYGVPRPGICVGGAPKWGAA